MGDRVATSSPEIPFRTIRRRELRISSEDLPALPALWGDVLRVANDPDSSMTELQSIVTRDQSLAARVLAVANSPAYDRPRMVDSIHSAVVLLGLHDVQRIATALALAPTFRNAGAVVSGPRLWKHALACAVWTEKVGACWGRGQSGLVYTAALLHDIGILVLSNLAPESVESAARFAQEFSIPYHEAEKLYLGIDHAKVGELLCQKWELPERLAELVSRHHSDGWVDDDLVVLRVADLLADLHGAGEFRRAPDPAELRAVLDASGLANKEEDLLRAGSRVEARLASFGL